MPPRQCVLFLSTVTNEFKPYREFLRGNLAGPNLLVHVQEDFKPFGEPTLEELDNYIQGSTAVLHFAGEMTGATAHPESVAALLARHSGLKDIPFLRDALSAGNLDYSYTQWEAYLAVYHHKRLLIAVPENDAERPATFVTDAAQQARQRDHLARLESLNRHPSIRFKDKVLLANSVLRGLADLLPPEHTIVKLPYPSLGTLFKGREPQMAALRASLLRTAGTGKATAIVGRVVHGLGGVGKTRLAVEYAHRHAGDYDAVLFVSGETPQTLAANLAALTGPLVLNLPEQSAREQEVQVQAAIRWMQEHHRWFIIIDNLDTEEAAHAAEELLQNLHGGHVLFTSRLTGFSGAIEPLELDVLGEEDAAAFLLERTENKRRKMPTDLADARLLAVDLGGLALALEQAGAYVGTRRISLSEYLTRWRSHVPAVMEWYDEHLMKYPRSVAVTWQTTLDQLSAGDLALLRLLAGCDPEPIPRFVLESKNATAVWREAVTLLLEESPTLPPAPAELEESLAHCANFSMVKFAKGADAVIVHRVVQEILRQRIPGQGQAGWWRLTLNLLDAARPVEPPQDVRSWPVWAPLSPHVLFATHQADQAAVTDPTARLMNELALYYKNKTLHAQAEPLYRRSIAIVEQLNSKEAKEVAPYLNNLAQLLQATNRLPEAELLMRRALAIDEQSYGPDHPEVATDLNNLASLLKATNRLPEAEPLMRRALAIGEQSYGPDHPNVAIRLGNLALLLQATNRLPEAEPLMRRALAIDEQSYGPDHPNVARDLNNLALLLQATNRLAEAEPLMRRALAIDEQSYGPDHPNVAIHLSNLAQLLKATNRLAEAEPLMRRALAIDEQSYGPDHPEVATDLNNLASLLKATNRLPEAEPLMRRALEIRMNFTRSTGHRHPRLNAAINNYRILLMAMGRTQEQADAATGEICPELFGGSGG